MGINFIKVGINFIKVGINHIKVSGGRVVLLPFGEDRNHPTWQAQIQLYDRDGESCEFVNINSPDQIDEIIKGLEELKKSYQYEGI